MKITKRFTALIKTKINKIIYLIIKIISIYTY